MATLYKYSTGGREVTYLDQDDVYEPEQIRQHWAGTFPELGNASTDIDDKAQTVTHEGQEVEVDRVVSFAKKVGTKGCVEDLLLFEVQGYARLLSGGRSGSVYRQIRALNEERAAESVLDGLYRDWGGDVAWLAKPQVALIPEDEMMRRAGFAMLPGFDTYG